jgi:hypothetical protein
VETTLIGELTLTYLTLESLDYSPGGQLYGAMDGRIEGERLSGALSLTNLAPRRPDDVNMPTLRGILTTDDDAKVWLEIDGIATLRASDEARVFVTSCRFRTGNERYAWLNTTLAVLEGVLDSVGVGGVARGHLHACSATIS